MSIHTTNIVVDRDGWHPRNGPIANDPVTNHWLCCDGEDIPPLDQEMKDQLAVACSRLVKMDLDDSIWINERQFYRACVLALTYCGCMITTHVEHPPGSVRHTPFGYFTIKKDLVLAATTGSTTHPGGVEMKYDGSKWKQHLGYRPLHQKRQAIAEAYSHVPGVAMFNPKRVLWQAGVHVAETNSFKMYSAIHESHAVGIGHMGKLLEWIVDDPHRLDLIDQWCERVAVSKELSVLVSGGFINQMGYTDRLGLIQKRDVVKDYFGLDGPGLRIFDRWIWPQLMKPLIRRAIVRKRELESTGGGGPGLRFDSSFVRNEPVDHDDALYGSILRLNTWTRDLRQEQGELLTTQRRNQTLGGSLVDELQTRIDAVELSLKALRIWGLPLLIDACRSWTRWSRSTGASSRRSHPESPSMIKLKTRMIWEYEVDTLDEYDPKFAEPEGDDPDDGDGDNCSDVGYVILEQTPESKGALLDGVEAVEEGVIASRALDEDVNLSDVPQPPVSQIEPPTFADSVATWEEVLRDDLKALTDPSTSESTRLFATASAVMRDMVEGTKTAEDREAAGLVRVSGFGDQLFGENCDIFARIPEMHPDVFLPAFWTNLVESLAFTLAVAQHSKMPFIYTIIVDLIFDSATEDYSKSRSSDEDSREGLHILTALRDYANGAFIAASIGSRTMIARDRAEATVRWLSALVYMWASFGFADNGPDGTHACSHCGGTQSLMVPVNKGTQPFIATPFRDRLTVSNYTPRRGFDHDCTKRYGRADCYACLVVLLYCTYHKSFIVIWCYSAMLVHQSHKNQIGKYSTVLTSTGRKLTVTV